MKRSAIGLVVAAATALGGVPVPAVAHASKPLECVPAISTLQIPIPSIGGTTSFTDLPAAPRGVNLPRAIHYRDNTQGFNDTTEYTLTGGRLYARARGTHNTWRAVPTPGCLNGHIASVSIDNDTLVGLDRHGWIYTMANASKEPSQWNWTRLFGAPIWLSPGTPVPSHGQTTGRWAISQRKSESFVDARGFKHPTQAGLVQLVSLAGDGSRIIFQDPWLPADHSYEIGGPADGRFISNTISGSGSVTFVMNQYGDMYTRKYDLDLAGSNDIPGRYTWQHQAPGTPSAPNQIEERLNPAFAAISLPAPTWIHQPKIPGEVTSRISINDDGPTMEDRELRVEGRSGGATGYWHKGLTEKTWKFTTTNDALTGDVLAADPSTDQTSLTLAAPSGLDFAGVLPGGWKARIDNYDWAQTTNPVTLTAPSGKTYTAQMHTSDGLRQTPRGPGLDGDPRIMVGALDLTKSEQTPELKRLIRNTFEGRRIYEINLSATKSQLVLSPVGVLTQPLLTLTRR